MLKIIHNNKYRLAIGRVPVVVARNPRQIVGERCEEESQAPCNDDIVEEIHVKGDQHNRISNACIDIFTWNKTSH